MAHTEPAEDSRKSKLWHVVTTNCDCGSDVMILDRRPRWFLGPKCRGCRTVLGPADWVYEGTVRAPDVFGANIAWKKEIRMKLADATPCVWEGKTRENGHEWYYSVTADSHRCRNCGLKVK